MASSSNTCGGGSRIEAPSGDKAPITPQLINLEFEAMSAMEIIAHLNRSRRTSDFDDAILVFAARERRLALAEAQIRRDAEIKMGLQAKIHTLELRAAANTEARARHRSGISERALTQKAGCGLGSIKEAYGEESDRKVLEDVVGERVIAGPKVPNEEAHGEDAAASHHGCSQGEQATRATKKARRQETCFYTLVLNALKEKQELLLRRENEAAAKKAAAAASRPLECNCWWSGDDGLNDS